MRGGYRVGYSRTILQLLHSNIQIFEGFCCDVQTRVSYLHINPHVFTHKVSGEVPAGVQHQALFLWEVSQSTVPSNSLS